MEVDDKADNLRNARFLRAKVEYDDARAAYNETLNRASAGMMSPMAMQSSYNSSSGPERAATDPWVREKQPELANAAQRVVSAERQYQALDEPISSHAQGNCSIVSYTAAKFYEYVAMAEMLYKLSTDARFRDDVVAKLGKLTEEGGLLSDIGALLATPNSSNFIAGLVNSDISKRNMENLQASREAGGRLAGRIASTFADRWKRFKEEYERCGLASAVARAGVDGVFLAGEIVVGNVALKGIKFAYRLTKEGLHTVEIISVQRATTIASHGWSREALEAKYGKPNQNQVGGVLTDKNNVVKDGPAETPKASTRAEASPPRPLRTKEELLPGGRVPTFASGKFNSWWNGLSPAELRMLWADDVVREQIEAQVRAPGGLHEWLMTGMGPKIKEMGFSMDDIKAMTTPTKDTTGPIPGASGERWRHNAEEGKGSGPGSGRMHKALQDAIEGAKDRADLLQRLEAFSHDWLDNGPDSFPPALRDLIINR